MDMLSSDAQAAHMSHTQRLQQPNHTEAKPAHWPDSICTRLACMQAGTECTSLNTSIRQRYSSISLYKPAAGQSVVCSSSATGLP
eukprot:630930-Pelagomonas_calceolata.AAC.3